MHRDVLANLIVITNAQSRGLAVVLQILRCIANHRPGVDAIVFAERGFAREMRVRTNLAALPNCHTRIDDGVRPHGDGFVQLGFGVDDGGRVNH